MKLVRIGRTYKGIVLDDSKEWKSVSEAVHKYLSDIVQTKEKGYLIEPVEVDITEKDGIITMVKIKGSKEKMPKEGEKPEKKQYTPPTSFGKDDIISRQNANHATSRVVSGLAIKGDVDINNVEEVIKIIFKVFYENITK